MNISKAAALGLVVWIGLAGNQGCGDSSSGPDADAGADADAGNDAGSDYDEPGDTAPDEDDGGAELSIAAQAVDTCGTWAPDHQPELNYQTPESIRIGIHSVDLMRTHKDPAPASVPLSDAVVEVDASAGGTILTVDTGLFPEDAYSHVRVGVAYVVYEVQATAHTIMDVQGTLEIDMALSNHVDSQGQIRAQGQYVATFTAFGQSFSMPGTTPLNCTLSEWGGIAFTTGTDFLVRVPIPGGPLVVDHQSIQPLLVDLAFPIRDTFAWRDLDEPGFVEGVLDISQPPGPVELPDSMFECHLLMADRCLSDAVNPLHPTWPMPDSNITFCTDGQQIVATCPGPGEPAYGQDANYSVHPMNYDVQAEIVTDLVSGLIWQRATPDTTYDWWEARTYCQELALGGFEDWRLPSRIELVSLLDFGGLDPTIDQNAFPDTPSDFFWTASPVPFLNLAYGVRFELGFIYDHDPHGSGRVRCVRGDYQPPDPRFVYDADTVTDAAAELVWQRQQTAAMTWLDALNTCETLDLAGFDDWRLPTLKELQTLVDDRRLQPSTDIVAFPGCPSEWFWSSTPIQFPPNEGWSTSFTDGYASIHAFDELHLVRCVRDP
jgi:hypothetical protein